jgi:hypothetical protein
MKLPNAENAIIADSKVRDYLLSFEHPVGRSKATFFASLGFVRDQWELLRDQLLALSRASEAKLGENIGFGQKYVLRGMIQGPNGRTASVKTVWIVKVDGGAPEFVTAFPGDRK